MWFMSVLNTDWVQSSQLALFIVTTLDTKPKRQEDCHSTQRALPPDHAPAVLQAITPELQMLFGVPNERQEEAKEYISAIQAGLRKVQGAIDLKYA